MMILVLMSWRETRHTHRDALLLSNFNSLVWILQESKPSWNPLRFPALATDSDVSSKWQLAWRDPISNRRERLKDHLSQLIIRIPESDGVVSAGFSLPHSKDCTCSQGDMWSGWRGWQEVRWVLWSSTGVEHQVNTRHGSTRSWYGSNLPAFGSCKRLGV